MLDLNNPDDAKQYVLGWVDETRFSPEASIELLQCTADDYLRLAHQLFVYCDKREIAGFWH